MASDYSVNNNYDSSSLLFSSKLKQDSSYSSSNKSLDLSSIFSNSQSNSSAIDITGISVSAISDFSLMKTGAYQKLLKAYYKSASDTNNITIDSTEKINLSKSSQDAQQLNSSAIGLMNCVVDTDHKEDIKASIIRLVEHYNSLIDSGSEVNSKNVLRNVLWMTQSTQKSSSVLSDIGITIGKGNKLEFDESKFDKAQLSRVKSVLTGNDSFVGRLSMRASNIVKASVNAVSDTNASAYNRYGMQY